MDTEKDKSEILAIGYVENNACKQLFINDDCLLTGFSAGAAIEFNLFETDIIKPLNNIAAGISFETIVEDVKQVLASKKTITEELQSNNGNWYHVSLTHYTYPCDNQNGVIITFTDISDLKKKQIELELKNKNLLLINEDLENFVYTVAHDLITPLSNIEGSIGVINFFKVADSELLKFLNIINFSVQKFRSLISDISQIPKIGSEAAEIETVDLNGLVDDIAWSLQNAIELSDAVITRSFEVNEIRFSKKSLRSILYNLILNGIKFKRNEKPVINICTEIRDNIFTFSVQDNGIGIPKASIDKIFNISTRLHSHIDGNGIGLYLVKKIVNAANGTITVHSEVDKGSKFIVSFNLQPPQG